MRFAVLLALVLIGCGDNPDRDCPPKHEPNQIWTADFQMKTTCLLDQVYTGGAPKYSYMNIDQWGWKAYWDPDRCGVVLSHHYRTGMLPDNFGVSRLPQAVAEDKRQTYLHEGCHLVMDHMKIPTREFGKDHHGHWLWKHCGCS